MRRKTKKLIKRKIIKKRQTNTKTRGKKRVNENKRKRMEGEIRIAKKETKLRNAG